MSAMMLSLLMCHVGYVVVVVCVCVCVCVCVWVCVCVDDVSVFCDPPVSHVHDHGAQSVHLQGTQQHGGNQPRAGEGLHQRGRREGRADGTHTHTDTHTNTHTHTHTHTHIFFPLTSKPLLSPPCFSFLPLPLPLLLFST